MRVQRITDSVISYPNKENNLSCLDPIIEQYKSKRGSLIPLLQATQNQLGYIPQEAFQYLASNTNYSLSELYGVATFYAQFRLKKAGKHIIKVCHGTACHVQNATALTDSLTSLLNINNGETTTDGMFTLEAVACLGCCSLAPVMMIGNETYGKLTDKKTAKIINEIKQMESV